MIYYADVENYCILRCIFDTHNVINSVTLGKRGAILKMFRNKTFKRKISTLQKNIDCYTMIQFEII